MIDTVTAEMIICGYLVVLGVIGLYVAQKRLQAMLRAEDEYIAYVREIVDDAVKERER